MRLRLARPADADALVELNCAMALETERKALLPEVIGAGVRSLLGKQGSGFYVVAEAEDRVIGALLVTKEWSDWRNGDFWCIQSVYVRPDWRRQGVYKALYRHVHLPTTRDTDRPALNLHTLWCRVSLPL